MSTQHNTTVVLCCVVLFWRCINMTGLEVLRPLNRFTIYATKTTKKRQGLRYLSSHLTFRLNLCCVVTYLEREKRWEGGREGGRERETDRSYRDNLLTAVSFVLKQASGHIVYNFWNPFSPRCLVDRSPLTPHSTLHTHTHTNMWIAGSVYQYTAVVRKLLSLYLTLSTSQCKTIDRSHASASSHALHPFLN